MRLPRNFILAGALLAIAGSGCASDSAQRQPDSYQDIRQQELQSERSEFLQDTEQRLAKIDNEIGRLKARLEHESEFVAADEQAQWSQELFELQQQQDQLQAQLERARTASPEEWAEMRGNIGVAVDSLEAGASKLGREVSQVFAGDEAQKVAADSGLCPMMVTGAEAEVDRQGNQVVVEITTQDQANRRELQKRAKEVARKRTYSPGQQLGAKAQTEKQGDFQQQSTTGTNGSERPIDVQVRAEDTDKGARLVFNADNADPERLRAQLEEDAEHLDDGDCEQQ